MTKILLSINAARTHVNIFSVQLCGIKLRFYRIIQLFICIIVICSHPSIQLATYWRVLLFLLIQSCHIICIYPLMVHLSAINSYYPFSYSSSSSVISRSLRRTVRRFQSNIPPSPSSSRLAADAAGASVSPEANMPPRLSIAKNSAAVFEFIVVPSNTYHL
jgi:hypothetical protein